MGRHAQASKRGTVRQHGFLTAPQPSEFVPSLIAVPNTTIQRIASPPMAGVEWSPMSVRVPTGTVSQGGISAAASISVATAVAATQYKIYAAWYSSAGRRISDWGYLFTITTP